MWFSDKILFTLTTQKIWRIESGAQRIKRWSKNAFCARMTFSQSQMVTDEALKLDYASVIFVDPAVQIDRLNLII